ncbi:MAG: PLP-dependent aminotransferase family protein [Bacteroidetes bacterium]|nr:MAG: PLP-dependent aminotransferase family protein [Bacteroidota bacterium]
MLKKKRIDDHLYLQVAGGIEKMIGEEILKIGDKLPSVRMLSEEYGISMGTAFQAYYHLEGKGLIESRPKSGYYVRFSFRRFPRLPRKTEPEPVENEVSVEDMISKVFTNLPSDDLLNFSVAVPPLELLPAAKINKAMLNAIRNSKNHGLNYEHVQGNKVFRKQLAKLSFNWGGKFSEEDIVVTAGCLEALVLCLRAVTKPGDTVAIESPTYFGIFQAIESLGLKAVEISTDPVAGLDIDDLQKAIRKFSIKACVFVPNFNNPLGSCMPDNKKQELVELITRCKIPLIEDDIYGEMYFGRHRPKTCKAYDKEGWVLYCSSFSKSLAPGYRVGWAMPGMFTEKVVRLKLTHTNSTATVTQLAISHFLNIGRYEYHLKKLRTALYTQCLRYIQGIIQYFPEDSHVSRPQGGFVLWIELNKKIDSYKLYQEAMKHQISITPGQVFSTQKHLSNCLRISYAKPWSEEVENGLKVIGDLIKKMMKK